MREWKSSRVASNPGGCGGSNFKIRSGSVSAAGSKVFRHRVERTPLLCGRHDLSHGFTVAAHRVGVIEPAHHFCRRLQLVAVEHVDRNEHFFERAHRSAETDFLFRKSRQRLGAHQHDAIQFVDGIGAGVPQVPNRICAALSAGVAVGDEHQSLVARFIKNGVQRSVFVGACGELGVAIANCDLVPLTDAARVGMLRSMSPAALIATKGGG